MVVWTCNHCPYALAWHDRLVQVARDYAPREVRFLAINSNDAERYPRDSLEAMRERVREEEWPFPYLHDESQAAAREWAAQVTPHVYLLDGDLRVRYEGAPDGDHMDPAAERFLASRGARRGVGRPRGEPGRVRARRVLDQVEVIPGPRPSGASYDGR